jgi:hypothetical protein
MAERLLAIIKASAPTLLPRTSYWMPAYANDGKVVCFFKVHRYREPTAEAASRPQRNRSLESEAIATGSVKEDFKSVDRSVTQLRPLSVDAIFRVAQVHIEDSSTPAADEMVVVVDGWIILSRASGPLERGNQSGLDQFLEIAMNGCRSDRRQDPPDVTVKIVGRRMLGRLAKGAQELHPLRGEAYSRCPGLVQERLQRTGHLHTFIVATGQSCVKLYYLILSIIRARMASFNRSPEVKQGVRARSSTTPRNSRNSTCGPSSRTSTR